MTPPNFLGAPRYRRKWNPRIAAQQRKEREASRSRDERSWDELSKSEMQNYEGIGNGKRQETLQRLKFRYNYQFIFCNYCFFNFKTWQMPKKQFMPRKFFQFHTSSMVNLLRQKLLPNVQRRLFVFFGRNCDLEFTQCGAGEEQKKHQGCINDEWNSWVWCFFFFFVFVGWLNLEVAPGCLPLRPQAKAGTKTVERKLWWVNLPQHFDRTLVFFGCWNCVIPKTVLWCCIAMFDGVLIVKVVPTDPKSPSNRSTRYPSSLSWWNERLHEAVQHWWCSVFKFEAGPLVFWQTTGWLGGFGKPICHD